MASQRKRGRHAFRLDFPSFNHRHSKQRLNGKRCEKLPQIFFRVYKRFFAPLSRFLYKNSLQSR